MRELFGIEKFSGSFDDQHVAIVAPGPTLKELKSLDDFGIAIFVGDAHLRTSNRAKRNVYVRANTEFPRLDSATDLAPLLSDNFEFVIASSVMESSVPVAEMAHRYLNNSKVTFFDQRHFFGRDCEPATQCCYTKLSMTIQEHLAKLVAWDHHYSQGATVLVHALALAIIGKPRKIHIFGAGIPLKQSDYVYAGLVKPATQVSNDRKFPKLETLLAAFSFPRWLRFYLARVLLGKDSPSILAEDIVELIADFQYLADAAATLGIQIFNRSSRSNLSRVAGYRQFLGGKERAGHK